MAELPIGRKAMYSVDWAVGLYLSLIALSATVLVWEMFLSLNFIRKDIAILERSFEWLELFVALSSFIVIYSAIGTGKYFSKLYIMYGLTIFMLSLSKYFAQHQTGMQVDWSWYEIISVLSILGVPHVFRTNSLYKLSTPFAGGATIISTEAVNYEDNQWAIKKEPPSIEDPLYQGISAVQVGAKDNDDADVNRDPMVLSDTNNKQDLSWSDRTEPGQIETENVPQTFDSSEREVDDRIASLREMAGLRPADNILKPSSAGTSKINNEGKGKEGGDASSRQSEDEIENLLCESMPPADNSITENITSLTNKKVLTQEETVILKAGDQQDRGGQRGSGENIPENTNATDNLESPSKKVPSQEAGLQSEKPIGKDESLELLQELGLIRKN